MERIEIQAEMFRIIRAANTLSGKKVYGDIKAALPEIDTYIINQELKKLLTKLMK